MQRHRLRGAFQVLKRSKRQRFQPPGPFFRLETLGYLLTLQIAAENIIATNNSIIVRNVAERDFMDRHQEIIDSLHDLICDPHFEPGVNMSDAERDELCRRRDEMIDVVDNPTREYEKALFEMLNFVDDLMVAFSRIEDVSQLDDIGCQCEDLHQCEEIDQCEDIHRYKDMQQCEDIDCQYRREEVGQFEVEPTRYNNIAGTAEDTIPAHHWRDIRIDHDQRLFVMLAFGQASQPETETTEGSDFPYPPEDTIRECHWRDTRKYHDQQPYVLSGSAMQQ